MIRPLYKAQEPFMEVKRGHGYQGVVMYDDVEDKVQCHICGAWYSALGPHIFHAHEMYSDDYKMEYGLTLRTALCGIGVSAVRRKTALRSDVAQHGKINLAKARLNRKRRRPRQHGKSTVMKKNDVGLCALQMRTRYDVVKEIVGHEPKQTEIIKFDKKLWSGIEKSFGSIGTYRKRIGVKVHFDSGRPYVETVSLVAQLRKFSRAHGRVPTRSDFRTARNGYSSTRPFDNRFGSWSNALRVAGIK